MVNAWLGLGSNLQQPEEQLREALRRLDTVTGVNLLRVSSLFRTPPWGDEEQDDFINAVAQVDTALDPAALLNDIQLIENLMGRQRDDRRWGPRLIDIDLLLYGDLQVDTEELVIPHPRMHQRAFVLVPLFELEPGLVIPGCGRVDELLQQVDAGGIERLEHEGTD